MDDQKACQGRQACEQGETNPPEQGASQPSSVEAPQNAKLQQDYDALRSHRALTQAKADRGSGEQQQEASAWETLCYRALFDNANDAVFAYHLLPEGTPSCFFEVNRVACERYGYTREELLRLTPADVVDPSSTSVTGKLQELRRKGRFVAESVHLSKDGARIISEVSAHLLEISGRPTVLSLCRDITARRQAEEELHHEKERLQDSLARRKAVLDSALDCIITMDDEGHIVEFNASAERVLGYRREEVIGTPLAETIVPPRLRDAHRRGMDRFLRTGENRILSRRIEMPALHASGREILVELTITCTWLVNERPFFTGYLRDITERKQAEEEQARLLMLEQTARAEAEASEERMAFLAEASVLLASSLDYEMTLQRVADLAVPRLADWCAVTMYDPEAAAEEAPGAAFQQVAVAHVDPEKVAWARELRTRYPPDPEAPVGSPHVIRTGQPQFYPEMREEDVAAAATSDEHLELLQRVGLRSVIIVPMMVRGEAIGAITLVWSESEKNYAEPDLRLAEELARRAALEIHNARLYHKLQRLYREAREARLEAEEMSRLKSAFLANMSHEIRTPLTSIIGFASVLTKRVPDEEQEFARRILAGGRRLMDTLDAVLALSRLEASQTALQLEALCVADEARQTLALMERQAQQKGLALHLRIAPGAEEASAYLDGGALHSILQNLVGNAIKFTDEGEVIVTLDTDNDHVRLHVEDTGSGIDEAFLPYLFEPFQQESKGWARSHEGAGLGLALTKQLVEIMGGRIDIQSEQGVGSHFTVSFPRASAHSQEEGSSKDAPAPGAQQGPQRTMRHLLVVEDNPDTQLLMRTLLGDLGEVSMAPSAETAVEEARRRSRPGSEEARGQGRPFDLCLVDINLGPGKSGVDVLKELREMPSYRDTPLVAVTGYALPGDRERLLEMGFDDYLAKPFDPEELLDLTSRLLSR